MTLRSLRFLVVALSAACSATPTPSSGAPLPGSTPTTSAAPATALPMSAQPTAAVPAANPAMTPAATPAPSDAAAAPASAMAPQMPATQTPAAQPPAAQPLAKPAIAFVSFYVTDLAKELAFYTGIIGMEQRAQFQAADGTMETSLGFQAAPRETGLLLLQSPDHKTLDRGNGYNRFGLKVADLAGLVTQLRNANITIITQPTRNDSLKLSYAMIQDPDGYRIECLQYETPSGGAPPAPGALPRIGFVALRVADDKAALAFYDQLSGLKEQARIAIGGGDTEIVVGWPDTAGATGLLLLYNAMSRTTLSHGNAFSRFGLAVPALTDSIAKLTTANVKIAQPLMPVAELKYSSAMIADADGYAIELLQYQ